jgi:hypothetical protein
VDAARDQVLTDCENQPDNYRSCTSILSKVEEGMFPKLHKDSPLEKALKQLSVSNPQNPWGATTSDLAPHVDLQLQPPPHLLLELLLQQLEGDGAAAWQFQECYGLDAEQVDGLHFLMAADESFAWMHQIAQQVQQQQQQQQRGCGTDQQQEEHQQQQQAGQKDSCNGSTAAQPAPAAAGVWQVLQQVHQQRDNHPRTAEQLQQLPAATDAASIAASLVQLLAQGSVGPAGGKAALDQSTCRQTVQQLRVLGGALVLQFVSAARAAGGPAWQQEVPLQAVVLFGALEQMQGLALAYLERSDVVRAAAELASSNTMSPEQQQQQQQPHADTVSSDGSDSGGSSSSQQAGSAAPHSQPCAALLRVVRKAHGLLQLLRQFRDANAALNAAAAADPSAAAAAAAREVLPVPVLRGLAACQLFSAKSSLPCILPEPCGHGIWAPAVSAAAGAEAHVVPGSSSSDSSDSSSWAAGDGSSTSCGNSPWFTARALAALAGAGVLSQRAHQLLLGLHDDLANGDLQEKLVEDVVQLLQMLSRCSGRDQRVFGQQQQQQEEWPELLQQLQRSCQEHGMELPPELLQQLCEVPATVLQSAFSKWQQAAESSGIDVQRSSSFRSCWNHRQVLALPGDAASTAGKAGLW